MSGDIAPLPNLPTPAPTAETPSPAGGTAYEACEPDEWVDSSYDRRECDDDGCRNVYVRRGHWRSGHCGDIRVCGCSDDTEREFR
jgi:hypothetical protein